MPATKVNPHLTQQLASGVDLLNSKRSSEAVRYFQKLTKRYPENLDCLDYLATSLFMDDQFTEADDVYRRCYDMGARFPESLCNAARNAGRLRRHQAQYEYAKELLPLDGDMRHEGLRMCAEALGKLGKPVQALAACRQVVKELPGDFRIQGTMVRQLLDMGMADSALRLCNELLPDYPDNKTLLMARVEACFVGGNLRDGIEYSQTLLKTMPESLEATSALGFYYQFDPRVTVAMRREHARKVAKAILAQAPAVPGWQRNKSPNDKLRIGLVTGDLRQHPVGYFMQGLMTALQNSSLEFVVFDPLPAHDDLTGQFQPLVKAWHDVPHLDDESLAQLIRNEKIDILLDIQGFMTGNRLSVYVWRPAPVQVSWMGFQGTTGAPGIDYVLVDPYCVPPGAEDEFEETVWRLPENTLCFTPPAVDMPVQEPPVLENGFITFGSLNNPEKLNDQVLALWAKVLEAVPRSRLLLRGSKFHSREYVSRFRNNLAKAGFELNRVTLEGPARRDRFLQTYHRIDIALDPFPCSGATTTAEALWAGVPVLCMKGDRMIWRMAQSILNTCGMLEWLAEDQVDFVAKAVRFANDPGYLKALRARQREQVLASPLFDAEKFAGQFEKTLRQLYVHHHSD